MSDCRPERREDVWERCTRVQAEASALGFDWPDVEGVLDKVGEELGEIREALAAGDTAHAQCELGDLLLASVNLARFLGISPTQAVESATNRFENRFDMLRESLRNAGIDMESCALETLESHWQRVKGRADKRLKKGS